MYTHLSHTTGLSEIVTLLLDRGADYSCADAVGATPLHYAVCPPTPFPSVLHTCVVITGTEE